MYKRILVPLDGSELAECVLPHVESIATGCGTQEAIFLRVVEPFSPPSGGGVYLDAETINRIDADNKAAAQSYLGELRKRTRHNGVSVKTEVTTGAPAETIANYATKNSVDLIAIATHGRSGISRWAWGSVADRLLRSACVPILMVRAPGCVPGIS
jgi:nucleotide-binding universal stress UspA family protein